MTCIPPTKTLTMDLRLTVPLTAFLEIEPLAIPTLLLTLFLLDLTKNPSILLEEIYIV